jgi:hypothetical protein
LTFRGPWVHPLTFLIRIGAGSLFCLAPLALYLLFLATLNHRRRATMLSGVWDYTCLLLGLSGFLLAGGPVLVSAVDSGWRSYWFGGHFADLKKVWHTNGVIWSIIAGGYLTAVGGLIGLFMFLRKRTTVIYNIDPPALPEALIAALDECRLTWRQVMGGVEIGRAGVGGFVTIQSFPLLRNASLQWRDEDPLVRQEVEAAIDKLLQASESPANPVGGWFMTAAVTLFVIMVIWMAFLIWALLVHPKWL